MLRFVARVLVLFLALHVSVAGPLLWGDCCSQAGDDCSEQSDRRQPCDDCPPGCPRCHCARPPFSVPPAIGTACLQLDPIERRLAWTPCEAKVSREAPLSSIFRPPKRV